MGNPILVQNGTKLTSFEEKPDTLVGEHTLLHWEALLVVTA
jgi:hypothetical protein